MVAALALLLGQTAGSADATILSDLKEKGFVASPYASPGGAIHSGILQDPATGFEGRWNVSTSNGAPRAFLTLILEFDRVIDREAVRSRLKPEELRAMGDVYLPLSGEVRIPAGTSVPAGRKEWEAAVTLARTLKKVARAETVPMEANLRAQRNAREIPLNLRVTGVTEEDLTQVAVQRGWPDANIGGVSGMAPISRAAAPRAFVYVLSFGDETGQLFAGETRRVYIDPQFYFVNVKSASQRRTLEAALPGWSFGWDEGEGEGGTATWILDVTPGYRLGEIAQALERESLRSVTFRKQYGKQFLVQLGRDR